MPNLDKNFEGTEKKLELLLKDNYKLRSWPQKYFEEVCNKSGADILSSKKNEFVTAYLLSESSMFVYDTSVIMITCGTTCILDSFDFLLEKIPKDDINHIFYERKNPLFPKEQKYTFDQDAKRLNKIIEGKAYMFGSNHENHVCLFYNKTNTSLSSINCTFEILMHNLSDEVTSKFIDKNISQLKLDKILEGFNIDQHHFNPPGYSLNAIKDKEYYTIHVTPNKYSSYASFETNHVFNSDDEYQSMINNILKVFNPNTFDIVQYQPKNTPKKYNYDNRRKVRHKLGKGCYVEFYNFFKPDKQFSKPIQIAI